MGERRGAVGPAHCTVDRDAGGFAHVGGEAGLDEVLAGGKDELEIGRVVDIGADRPDAVVDGVDGGELRVDREAVEIDVGVPEEGRVVGEDAEDDAVPLFGVDRPVEEGLALQSVAVEHDRDGAVQCRPAQGGSHGLGGTVGVEADRGSVRGRGAFVGDDRGVGLAHESLGRDLGAPARGVERSGAGPGRDAAAAPAERVDADTGRVLAVGGGAVPAAAAEGEQDGGIGDAAAVVGDEHEGAAVRRRLGGDVDPGRIAAARVGDQLDERVVEGGGEEPGDPVDRGGGDVGADRGGQSRLRCHGGLPGMVRGRAPRDMGAAGRS